MILSLFLSISPSPQPARAPSELGALVHIIKPDLDCAD